MDGEFTLDPYFENLEKKCSEKSDAELQASLAKHGCVYPVVVWKERGILLDGYRRVRLCQGTIPYTIKEKSFNSREAAEHWVRTQQSARRNLDPESIAESRLRAREIVDEMLKARDDTTQSGGNTVPTKAGGEQEPKPSGTRSIAAAAGVSRETVKRAARKAKAAKEAEASTVAAATADESREENRLAEVFDEAISAFKAARKAVDAIWDATDGCRDFFHSSLKARLIGHISNANDCLKSIRPETHNRCRGLGCDGCQQRGWVGKGINQGER